MNSVNIDSDFESILLSAVRYALGRRTYIVSITCGYVKRVLHNLSYNTLFVMERDIIEHGRFGEDAYGDDMDLKDWMDLLNNIREEMNRRSDKNV